MILNEADIKHMGSGANVKYPTGISGLDFYTGSKHTCPKTGNPIYKLGIKNGSIVIITGRTNAGKTTNSLSIIGNILAPFDKGEVYHLDVENSSDNPDRTRELLNFDEEKFNNNYMRLNSNISIESVEELLHDIGKAKAENKEKYLYDTGIYEKKNGKIVEIVQYQPTVIFLDSLTLLSSRKNFAKVGDEHNQMDNANNANVLSTFLKTAQQKCTAYNIIIIAISHEGKGIEINAFSKERSAMAGLKQSTNISGGKSARFLGDLILTTVDRPEKSKGEFVNHYGADGFKVDLEIMKSRSTRAGKKIPTYMFTKTGIDIDISNFLFLEEFDYVTQSGSRLKMKGYEKSFYRSEIKSLIDNPESGFKQTLNQNLVELVKNNIDEYKSEEIAKREVVNLLSMLS